MANEPGAGGSPSDKQRIEELERSCRRMIRELDEKGEKLNIVNGMLRVLAGDGEIKDVLQVFAANLKTLCTYDQISVALFDPDNRKFIVPFVLKVGRVAENKSGDRTFADEDLVQVLEKREPTLRRNLKPEDMKVKGDTTFVKRVLSCELMVPLTLGSKRFGLLMVSCFDPDGLRDEHLDILADLAPVVSVVVHHFLDRNAGRIPY